MPTNTKSTVGVIALTLLVLATSALADHPRAEEQTYVLGSIGENQEIEYCDPGTGNFCFSIHPGDSTIRLVIADLTNAATTATGGGYAFHDAGHSGVGDVVLFCQDSGEVPVPAGATHIHAVVAGPILTAFVPVCPFGTALPATAGTMTAHFNGHT